METPMLTGTLFYCVLFVFISGISSLTTYRSCLDVKHGSNPPNTKDGDYPLLIKNKLVTPIYCAGKSLSLSLSCCVSVYDLRCLFNLSVCLFIICFVCLSVCLYNSCCLSFCLLFVLSVFFCATCCLFLILMSFVL